MSNNKSYIEEELKTEIVEYSRVKPWDEKFHSPITLHNAMLIEATELVFADNGEEVVEEAADVGIYMTLFLNKYGKSISSFDLSQIEEIVDMHDYYKELIGHLLNLDNLVTKSDEINYLEGIENYVEEIEATSLLVVRKLNSICNYHNEDLNQAMINKFSESSARYKNSNTSEKKSKRDKVLKVESNHPAMLAARSLESDKKLWEKFAVSKFEKERAKLLQELRVWVGE